ncbi:MAG: acyltransferase family protein [Verrucomicrobiales bacterium]|nr:acyltransferase family protein [Nitrospinaceae bacterium]
MPVNNRSDYIQEIDGLRGFAVLAVMVFHFKSEYLPYGFLGVDIFFVISGYVICKAIIGRIEVGRFTINDFFMRRFRRIIPALTVVVMITSIVSLFLMPNNVTFITGTAALFGMSNVALWSISQDYFSVSALTNANLHTWSLGVEEQFYLIFPFVLLFIKRRRLLVIFVIGIAFVSLLSYIAMWSEYKDSVFFLVPFRLWELASGVLVYFSHHFLAFFSPKTTLLKGMIKYNLLIGLIAILFSEDYIPENYATLLCVILTSSTLYFTKGDRNNIFLSNYISVFIGKISYSLYLWHWPVYIYTKLIFPKESIIFMYIVFTVILSLLSYYFIERPFRYRELKFCGEKIYIIFIIYVGVISILTGFLWMVKSDLYLGPKQMRELQFLKTSECHLPGKDGLIRCLKNIKVKKSIFLIGDSHAGNFKPPLQNVAEKYGFDFQFLTGRGLVSSLNGSCTKTFCEEGTFLKQANRLKEISEPNDIVVISFSRDRFSNARFRDQDFVDNFSKFIGILKTSKLSVFLIEDIPKVCSNDFEHFQSAFQSERCNISAQESRFNRKGLTIIYNKISDLYQLDVLDPHDLLCDFQKNENGLCSNMLRGNLLYLDSSPHLTFWASTLLTIFFEEGLQHILLRS